MNASYQRELAALRLLNRNWDDLSEDDQRGKHDTFMWTVQAAVDVGLVQFSIDTKEQS